MSASRTRPPRLSREEQKEQREKLLLQAAWAMFCEKGYEAVTIDHVAEYAGVSRMPVYYAFGDKQNLFFELWKKEIADILARVGACVRAGAPLRRNVEAIAKLTVEAHGSDEPRNGESLFFVVQTITLSRPDIAEKALHLSNEIVDYFSELIRTSTLEEGQQLRGTPTTAAAHMVALINGLSTLRFQTGRKVVKVRDLTEIFLTMVLKNPVA